MRRLLRWLGGLGRAVGSFFGAGGPLCDTCRYDYGDACRRPERPNARRCPDYQRK